MQLLKGVDISHRENKSSIEYNYNHKVYLLCKNRPLTYAYTLAWFSWHEVNKHDKRTYLTK